MLCFAQISPGDLTTAHADLEGISNCTKCHELGEQVHNDKCLSCHTEIKSLQNNNSGYHSGSDVKGKNCWSCHSEHHGRKFRIINFDPKSFNHDKAGYVLSGKHATTECNECHQSKYVSKNELIKRKNSYLGLSQICSTCHKDYHQATLGNDCGSCHDTKAFRPAPQFDHGKARYTLTGQHKTVDCVNCHKKETRNGKDFQVFKNIPFENCNSCHKDVHLGKFGSNCKQCHETSGFKNINTANFDHSKTDYPLLGLHRVVRCNDCHKTGMKKKIKHDACIDCHQDYHKAQFVVNGQLRDCSDCHNVNGFSPSVYTIEMHNQTKFQITGAHFAVPCESCHHKTEEWLFKGTGIACIDCHKNIHEGEIKTDFLPNNDCRACHDTQNWNTITFDHNRTKFKLSGKHVNQTCYACHVSKNDVERKILFSSLGADCEICHKDVHSGQFREGNSSDCGRCHTFENWKPEKFDHNRAKFSLEGAHQNLDCYKCHPVIEENNTRFIKYKLEDFKCAACHSS